MRHPPVQHCFRIDRGADGERLDDVAGHRLADGGIVEDPVEIRGVPQRGKTDRGGVRGAVLWLKQRWCQEEVAASLYCVQVAKARFSRLLRCVQSRALEKRVDLGRVLQEASKALSQRIGSGCRARGEDAPRETGKLRAARERRCERGTKPTAEQFDVMMRGPAFDS